MAEQSIPNSGTKGEGITREERGIQLFRDKGSEIAWFVDGTFSVPGNQEGTTYDVDLRVGEAGVCTCADFQARRNACKHIFAATIRRSKLLAIAQKEAQERKRVAEKRMAERIVYSEEQSARLIEGLDRMIS